MSTEDMTHSHEFSDLIEKERKFVEQEPDKKYVNTEYNGNIKHKGVNIDFDFGKVWKEHEEFVDGLKETLNLHAPGVKDDSNKPRLDLVLGDFANALWAVGVVGTYGANKYTDKGWHEVENGIERYSNALLRHYFKYKSGEYVDIESGLSHLAHMAWNALAILQLESEKTFTIGSIEEVYNNHPDFKPICKCSYKYDCDYKENE